MRRTRRPFPTIQAWMDATGTTQQQLARRLGISQSHLCNILRKKRNPSGDLALAIAKLTNVALETVLNRADRKYGEVA